MKSWTLAITAVAVVAIILFSYFAVLPRMNTATSSSETTQSSTIQTESSTSTTFGDGQTLETYPELLAIAGSGYSTGPIPVGDGKYTINTVKKGYIDYCALPPSGGGATGKTPWIQNGMWYPSEKPTVEGAVTWSNAYFTDTVSGSTRILSGNGLPVNFTTGIFPIQKSDPAYQYDANPNSIKPHNVTLVLPLNPTYNSSPHCMTPGEIGVMFNGIPLFDGMDAQQRDAAAHEVQDSCNGHPQSQDVYHYHDLSSCFKNINETHILGYALDGFPITGPEVAPGKYLDSSNLDACHGITSQINGPNGTAYTTYHYVLTYDFPYSISCFHGTPVSNGKPG